MTLEELLKNYQPSDEAVSVLRQARIVFFAGIIAAGKDTLQRKLLNVSSDYRPIVTHTTRQPRVNEGILEQNGREYHFVTREEMQKLVENREMIEVNKFGENFYGTHVSEFQHVLDEGKIAVANIDINGVASFKQIAPDSVTALFVVPPDFATWRRRLEKRYDSMEVFQKEWLHRRDITIAELEHVLGVDYYDYVINDDLERAIGVVDKIAHRDNTIPHRDRGARERTEELLAAIQSNQ